MKHKTKEFIEWVIAYSIIGMGGYLFLFGIPTLLIAVLGGR